MTSYNDSMNTSLSISSPNDDTLTNLLISDSTNNIKYRTLSSISNIYDQNLNTTNNVTFNTITTNFITSPAANNALSYAIPKINFYQSIITTANATFTTIFTFATTLNNGYLIYSEIAGKNLSGGGGAFYQTVRATNNDGTVTFVSMENVSNKTTSMTNSAIQYLVSGTNLLVQVKGILANTVDWRSFVRIIIANSS